MGTQHRSGHGRIGKTLTGRIAGLVVILPLCLGQGCSDEQPAGILDSSEVSHPTEVTRRAQARAANDLPLEDPADFEAARRGLIAAPDRLQIRDADGQVVWDMDVFDFEEGPAPESVNPSLWRQAQLNRIHGLFEVTPGIYQLRGFDLANMTLVRGDAGWIVVDPLTTRETASAAWEFAMQHLDQGPVSAVIYTHSHTDIGESHVLTLKNAVLHHRAAAPAPEADVTLKITQDLFVRMLTGLAGLRETLFSDQLAISGSRVDLLAFLMLFDRPDGNFNIVLP